MNDFKKTKLVLKSQIKRVTLISQIIRGESVNPLRFNKKNHRSNRTIQTRRLNLRNLRNHLNL